ncbi:MAG: universal stress protein [Rhodospirillales bacterium]
MSQTYIVGFDGTPQSGRAVEHAAAAAKKTGGKLHLVFVIEWSPYSFHTAEELAERHGRREQELDRAKESLQPVVDQLKGQGVTTEFEVRHGNAAELLCEIAKATPGSEIVIGRTGGSGLAQRLLGGLAMTLAQVAPVPITIVP